MRRCISSFVFTSEHRTGVGDDHDDLDDRLLPQENQYNEEGPQQQEHLTNNQLIGVFLL